MAAVSAENALAKAKELYEGYDTVESDGDFWVVSQKGSALDDAVVLVHKTTGEIVGYAEYVMMLTQEVSL